MVPKTENKRKIGRNDPCFCGSGKKYKKCCLAGEKSTLETNNHYFDLKGKNAERFVQELAENTFLNDWCYPNPKLPNNKELCDLLIVFDNIAIVWQIKDTKLAKDGNYREKDLEKNIRQLNGARRRLFDLESPIELQNPRRGKEIFDASEIDGIFSISCLMGEEGISVPAVEQIKESYVHIFTKYFTQTILTELDTIKDFVLYLRAKEAFLEKEKHLIISGGEEELLAHYLMSGRSFDNLDEPDFVWLTEGGWDKFQNDPRTKAKKEEDKISYGWDSIINAIHIGGSEHYEKIAREIARPNRFERRYLSKAFLDAHKEAHNLKNERPLHRIFSLGETTYYFLFAPDSMTREERCLFLENACWVARGFIEKNRKVIGIATEKEIKPKCSYDYCLVDIENLTDEDKKDMKSTQDTMQIFQFNQMQFKTGTEHEYPQAEGA